MIRIGIFAYVLLAYALVGVCEVALLVGLAHAWSWLAGILGPLMSRDAAGFMAAMCAVIMFLAANIGAFLAYLAATGIKIGTETSSKARPASAGPAQRPRDRFTNNRPQDV